MKRVLLACLLLACSTTTFAVPISYTFTGTYDFSYMIDRGGNLTERRGTFAGNFDSEYTATVVFDNGGHDTKDVVWTHDDFLYVTYESGDYSSIYESVVFNDFRNFVADENGVIIDGFLEVSNITQGALWLDVRWGEVNAFSSTGHGAMNGDNTNPLRSSRGRILPISEPSRLIALYLVVLGVIGYVRFRHQGQRRGIQGTLALPS